MRVGTPAPEKHHSSGLMTVADIDVNTDAFKDFIYVKWWLFKTLSMLSDAS